MVLLFYTTPEGLHETWDSLDERRESGERNEVEGKFGTGKRVYGLGRLTARLQDTCETQIHMIILTMNLLKKMKSSFGLKFRSLIKEFIDKNMEVLSGGIWNGVVVQ